MMKTLLFLSWLALGTLGYLGYGFYNDTLVKQTASNQALEESSDKIKSLAAEVDSLKSQLNTERQVEASLRQASLSVVAATTVPASPPPPDSTTPQAFVFPATITTIGGITYQGCKLDRASPDGISFFHSNGVAKVPYTDLDPIFAKQFGYDPAAAAQYRKEEAIKEGQSDAMAQSVMATQQQQAQTQASADLAQSKRDDQSQAAKVKLDVAEDQKRQIEDDMLQMVHAKQVSVNPTTGQAYGDPSWVEKYETDAQNLAKCNQIIRSGGY